MIYVMMCFNSRTADHRLREFVKKNYPFVKRHLCGLAGSFYAIMQNGDEYHFVPEFAFPRWSQGRHIAKLDDEWEIEREEKMTTEEMREYEKVRNKYESPFALNRKTDAEIAIEQAREIKNLKEVANEANEVIKKLNEENKALVEENAKLRKDNKELLDAQEGFNKLCELANGAFTVEMSALPIIEYQGMKFKATKITITEGILCGRTMEIIANSVSE